MKIKGIENAIMHWPVSDQAKPYQTGQKEETYV